ncbi:MAG: malto-oligosyltrehalose synthase, partial [Aurantimonas coralicida]
LAMRQRAPALFTTGAYVPLAVEGAMAAHVVAFARTDEAGHAAITIAPRLCLTLLDGREAIDVPAERWQETSICLPEGLAGRTYRDVVTGQEHELPDGLSLATVLAQLPFAMLEAI